MKNNLIFSFILSMLRGAIVGVGAILPGVSGGVLCVAFGIYEPMMELLTHPVKALKKNYKLFIPFIIGWVLGFILLARGVEFLFSANAAVALMLFLGLICGNIPELFKISEKSDGEMSWTPFVLSLAIAYVFLHFSEQGLGFELGPSFIGFLFCGLLWGLSLIVPGFSSSSVLINMGLYEPMTAGIGSLDPAVILPLFLGIGVTALLFARLVDMLYKKHYAVMSRIILGFVIASSLKIVPSVPESPITLLICAVCFAGGFAVARVMDVAKSRQETEVDDK